jgi:dipeptidyl aminopeptidase/acylaminoacyl peptidase
MSRKLVIPIVLFGILLFIFVIIACLGYFFFIRANSSTSSQSAASVTLTYTPIKTESTPILTPTLTNNIVSPLEEWIAFEHQNNIFLIHPDASGLKQVTRNLPSVNGTYPSGIQIQDFKWSPNGNILAVLESTSSDYTGNTISLYYLGNPYNFDTPNINAVITKVGTSFDWSPDGKQIIFDTLPSLSDNKINDGFWSIELETDNKTQIVPPLLDNIPPDSKSGIKDPQWSADGTHVIFSIYLPTSTQYGVTNLISGESIYLPITELGNCEWSPVDLLIACSKATIPDESGTISEIFIIDTIGNILQKIPMPEGMNMPVIHWSPDGTQLAIGYYGQENGGWTAILSLATGEIHSLAPGEPWAWSPDGEWIVVSQAEGNLPKTLSVVNVTTGQSTLIGRGRDAVWQP